MGGPCSRTPSSSRTRSSAVLCLHASDVCVCVCVRVCDACVRARVRMGGWVGKWVGEYGFSSVCSLLIHTLEHMHTHTLSLFLSLLFPLSLTCVGVVATYCPQRFHYQPHSSSLHDLLHSVPPPPAPFPRSLPPHERPPFQCERRTCLTVAAHLLVPSAYAYVFVSLLSRLGANACLCVRAYIWSLSVRRYMCALIARPSMRVLMCMS